jgi:hypothetical protein
MSRLGDADIEASEAVALGMAKTIASAVAASLKIDAVY